MITVNSHMTVDELFTKISKMFNVQKNMVVLTYDFKPPDSEESIKVEISLSDEGSLENALKILGKVDCRTKYTNKMRIFTS